MFTLGIGVLPVYSRFGYWKYEWTLLRGNSRPYFTLLVTIRREGESVDYLVGILSYKPVHFRHCLSLGFRFLIFNWFRVRAQPGGGGLVL